MGYLFDSSFANEYADLNAAINILVTGSCPETLNACGAGIRRGDRKIVSQPAMKQESAWS